jgi:hypothetical protein
MVYYYWKLLLHAKKRIEICIILKWVICRCK